MSLTSITHAALYIFFLIGISFALNRANNLEHFKRSFVRKNVDFEHVKDVQYERYVCCRRTRGKCEKLKQ
jgi:hypothetical protein